MEKYHRLKKHPPSEKAVQAVEATKKEAGQRIAKVVRECRARLHFGTYSVLKVLHAKQQGALVWNRNK